MIKQTAKRNRRIRKKLYLAEFSVFGQEFDVKLVEDDAQQDEFLDDFIDLIESLDMYCTGGNGGFLVCCNGRYDLPSDEQMSQIKSLLETHAAVSEFGEFKPLNLHYPD